MKYVAAVMTLLFLAAASVQFNDPDPLGWVAIYVAAAVLSAWSVFAIVPRVIAAPFGLAAMIWAATLFVEAANQNFSIDAEVPREFFGLIIVGIWGELLAARAWRTKQ